MSFQIVAHIPINPDEYEASGAVQYIGPAVLPAPHEAGWKDTVKVPTGTATRIVANYDRLGLYMFHCHIVSCNTRLIWRGGCCHL